ncbi:hypothetical protein P154DRAFT_432329 [Amniculicola lignicola CBS 123094]|uniref:Uncharacterized protein n=1 Tax=Amniculicola lignicola CBS 123094 TaxID=1392246 RepID=A0A6A5WRR1_9PLEO|nr:hypothetical protein P154DRAFT_432329 [Amniculicola lignicola CBS 123094]
MPPSSRRSTRGRREHDPQQHSDADTPESIATPSRKRRRLAKLNGTDRTAAAAPEDAARTRVTESMASNDSNITLPNGADPEGPEDPIERQNTIIAALRAPVNYTPNAAIDYANDLQARRNEGNIAAFAKIAARDWCFFVQKTVLLIGRAEAAARPSQPVSSQDATGLPQSETSDSPWGVDIDLGPERQISRIHAQINFESADQTWYITVNSRNGLKLDDMTLGRGYRAPLRSGICIGIMGTQMLFLLANQEDEFHDMLWRQVKNERDVDESDKEGGQPPRSLPHAHPSGPTPKREPYDPFPPAGYRNKSSQSFSNQLTSTPGRPMPGTPLAFRSTDPRSKGSPSAYPRGIMLDSTENIDYSRDSAKDIKPPHSYAQLIGQAILSAEEEMLTLANIYQYIKDNYAFFRHTNAGWQNSIRHNLSLSKCFEKVARRTDEPGKGMKWKIVDSEREDFMKKQLLGPRKGGLRMSSGPNSPAMRDPTQATERLQGALGQPDIFGHMEQGKTRVKSPPRSVTPPLNSYPQANESYTPDRGPRPANPFGGFKHSPSGGEKRNLTTPAKRLFQDGKTPGPSFLHTEAIDASGGLDDGESPSNADPVKPAMSGLRGGAANSPPPLFSDTPAANANGGLDTGRLNNAGLVTPLVSRHAPRLAPPSTAQVPSQFMHFSSPAPFWKYVDLPSTPARGSNLDISPIKMQKDGDDEPPQPSSPPIIEEQGNDPEDGDVDKADDDEDAVPDSPSRTVSRPVSRREVPASQRSRSNSNINGSTLGPNGAGNGGMVRGASLGSFQEEDDVEEGGFDLSKYVLS